MKLFICETRDYSRDSCLPRYAQYKYDLYCIVEDDKDDTETHEAYAKKYNLAKYLLDVDSIHIPEADINKYIDEAWRMLDDELSKKRGQAMAELGKLGCTFS